MSSRWLPSASWNALAVPWKLPRTVMGAPRRAKPASIALVACDSDTPSGRLNEIVEGAAVGGSGAALRGGDRRAGGARCGSCGRGGAGDVDAAQDLRALPELGRRFHDHVVLVQRMVDGRHLALA